MCRCYRLLTFQSRGVCHGASRPDTAGSRREIQLLGTGTIIHPRAVIGDRVEIGAGVVIGGRSEIYEVPVIEDDVLIGVGAKVLGRFASAAAR